jgi:hypothetical protein
MIILEAINTYPQDIGWDVKGECPIGDQADAEKIFFCLPHHIVDGIGMISPKKWFATLKDKNAHTLILQGFKNRYDCFKGNRRVFGFRPEWAVPAAKIALMGNFKACENWPPPAKNPALNIVIKKICRPEIL